MAGSASPRRLRDPCRLPPRPNRASSGFLHEIDVEEHTRRRGLGRTLVEEAKRIGRAAAAFKMYVLTEPGNTAANGLYASTRAEQETAVMWVWELSDRPLRSVERVRLS